MGFWTSDSSYKQQGERLGIHAKEIVFTKVWISCDLCGFVAGVQLSVADFETLEKSSGYNTVDRNVSDVSQNQKVW